MLSQWSSIKVKLSHPLSIIYWVMAKPYPDTMQLLDAPVLVRRDKQRCALTSMSALSSGVTRIYSSPSQKSFWCPNPLPPPTPCAARVGQRRWSPGRGICSAPRQRSRLLRARVAQGLGPAMRRRLQAPAWSAGAVATSLALSIESSVGQN